MTPCIDLRAVFAERFQFVWDAAYDAERPDLRADEALWLTQIPGTLGYVFPWGGRQLAAYSKGKRPIRDALQALPGVIVRQGGGRCSEVIVSFDVDLIEDVAAILKLKRPRVRRPLTARQLANLAAGRAAPFARKIPLEKIAGGEPDSTIASSIEEIIDRATDVNFVVVPARSPIDAQALAASDPDAEASTDQPQRAPMSSSSSSSLSSSSSSL